MALLHQVGSVEIFAKNRHFQYVEKLFLDKLASIPRYIGKFNDLPITRGLIFLDILEAPFEFLDVLAFPIWESRKGIFLKIPRHIGK